MIKIKDEHITIALESYQQTRQMLDKIVKGRPISTLSNIEYARAEYWNGKKIGMEDIFEILDIDYKERI